LKRKQQSKVFLLLLLCTLYIFAFSHFGSRAYLTFSTKNNTYSEGTMIGPVHLSGKSKDQALKMITNEVEQWRKNAIIQLNYRGKSTPFRTENITFLTNESIGFVKDGVANPLYVEVNTEALQKVITTLSPNVPFNENLEQEIQSIAQGLVINSEVKLDEYSTIEAKRDVLSSVKIEMNTSEQSFDTLSVIPIPAHSTFSMFEWIEKENLGTTSLTSLNALSSAIYQLILPTELTIKERHIGAELLENIPLGYEAKIDRTLDWDFGFTNNSDSDFEITITHTEGQLILDLVGYPLANTYEIELTNIQTFEPKTIKRYDPMLQPGVIKESDSGANGSYVEVYRNVISETGEWLGSELVSKDFYPPRHRIEIVGLTIQEQPFNFFEENNTEEEAFTIENIEGLPADSIENIDEIPDEAANADNELSGN
jgi:hypothetical protein